jgi:hypothetical protein
MREIEVSQALDVWEKHQGDEIQRCEVSEIPLHVWQDEEAEGVRLGRGAEEDFLSFRSTRDDLVYPIFMKMLEAGRAKEDGRVKPTIGCAPLGRRLCTALRCVRITRAFREQCGPAASSTVPKKKRELLTTPVRVVIVERRGMNDLANVHVSGWINDINLDVWPVLGVAQPAQHPRILEEERSSKEGVLSN